MKYGIAAQVRIVPSVASAYGEILYPSVISQAGVTPLILDTRSGAHGLQRVTVTNSIDAPFGHFTLQFAPEAVAPGGTLWDEAAGQYSLVTIALHRYGPAPAGTAEPVPVMIGITDPPSRSESYAQAQPQRSCTISGRGIAAILTDHQWWTHHWLAAVQRASNIPADLRDYFVSVPEDERLNRWGREQGARSLGLFAIDPELFLVVNRHPVDVIERMLQFYLYGLGPTSDFGPRAPTDAFIKVRFLDGVPLASRLRFDAAAAKGAFVDRGARLIDGMLPTSLQNASCWQAIRQFVDEQSMELYTETRGASVDDAYAEIICRKKPWAGQIGYDQRGGAGVEFANGKRPLFAGETLFDLQALDTVEIDGTDVIGRPQIQRGAREPIYTMYYVRPAVSAMSGDKGGEQLWDQLIPPIVDEFPDSPSYIETFGLRTLSHQLRYAPITAESEDTWLPDGDFTRHCVAYEALFREWYYRNPVMFSGSYLCKGRTSFRPGMRLMDRSSNGREYYVHTVHHDMALGPQASYTARLGVTRGWDLRRGVP